MTKKAPKFREFITEAKEEPYRLVILSHDDAEDPNKTGDLIRDKAKKLGIECILGEFVGAHTSYDIKNDELYIYIKLYKNYYFVFSNN